MTEPTYELNNFGKCMQIICEFLYNCFAGFFVIVFFLVIIGIILFMIACPFVYIYYITQHNWNVLRKTDDSSFLVSMSQFGFIIICVIVFMACLICSVCVWDACGLNDVYQSFKHAIFYKKVVTEEPEKICNNQNPMTDLSVV
jgi:hypothetical protein